MPRGRSGLPARDDPVWVFGSGLAGLGLNDGVLNRVNAPKRCIVEAQSLNGEAPSLNGGVQSLNDEVPSLNGEVLNLNDGVRNSDNEVPNLSVEPRSFDGETWNLDDEVPSFDGGVRSQDDEVLNSNDEALNSGDASGCFNDRGLRIVKTTPRSDNM
uniref:Uncharacterized protein n=1 Tax=Candidatus Kentrum sp. LFY TaxID=2126342 RepID=A0A450U5Q7_9GAMM|nr:MAG: hypothetical protein BECKLFY1418B_GA0070995_100389 [Candidatus Kentron sp. LFY]